MRRRVVGTAVAAGLLAVACTGRGADPASSGGGGNGAGVRLIAALEPFDACDDFLGWVKEAARQRVGAWGLAGIGGGGGPEIMTAAPGAATDGEARSAVPPSTAAARTGAVGASAADDAAAGLAFSGTNVQEQGVDEPDTVKTDGRRIVALAGSRLRVVDVTGGAPVELGSLDLGDDARAGQLLMAGDKALVLGSQGLMVWRNGRVGLAEDLAGGSAGEAPTALPSAVLREIDLSDPTRPKVLSTLRVEGTFLDARLVGTTARVVVQSSPAKLEFLAPSGPNSERAARRANQAVIEESTAEQWLPSYVLQRGDQETGGQLVPCERVHHPARFAGFSALSVLTVDLAAGLTPGDAAAVLADGQQVYASADNLYVAINAYEEAEPDTEPDAGPSADEPTTNNAVIGPRPGGAGDGTSLHMFSIRGSEPASYLASGQVRGHLMNDFSMSEYEGHLRVATTDGAAWAGPADTAASSESFVTVLARRGGELVPVGQVGELGRGERIYGVRFLGDVGYVVTFRQTDPLYTIDLSEPTAPRARGELKILGYSAYLHPLGDGRLLGVGQDATEEGRRTGAQVSVFDVGDLDHPQLVGKATLPAGWSDAEHDYHGFLWWAPAKLVALPMQIWPGDSRTAAPFAGVVGFTVDGTQVAERGRVSHPSSAGPSTTDPCPVEPGSRVACPPPTDHPAPITRSLVVGSTLYTLSEAGLKASSVADLADVGWLPFG